jgi:hypothetical protein
MSHEAFTQACDRVAGSLIGLRGVIPGCVCGMVAHRDHGYDHSMVTEHRDTQFVRRDIEIGGLECSADGKSWPGPGSYVIA